MEMRVVSLVLAIVAGLPFTMNEASAQKTTAQVFNAQQRDAIVDVMHQALKDDPRILIDAMQSLRQKGMEQQEAQSLVGVRANWQAISTAPSYAIRGNPHGDITVIEFLDPRCGYCRRMAPMIDQFIKRHPDVRFVEKVVPVLGNASVLSTRAIYAAAFQGHYDSMRRAVMAETAKPDGKRLEELARQQGLNVKKFEKDVNGDAVVALMAANLKQAQAVGVSGTPTIVFGQAVVAPGAMESKQMNTFLQKARDSK